jgi:hypothetical protein
MTISLSTTIDPAPVVIPGGESAGRANGYAAGTRPPPPIAATLTAFVVEPPAGAVSGTLSRQASSIEGPLQWQAAIWARVRELSALAPGWDGPGSSKVSTDALYTATGITRLALEGQPGAVAPYIVPGGDGSVQIEWHEEHAELELDIGSDGTHFSVWGRDHRSGVEFEGEDAEAINLFFRWAPRVATHPGDVADVSPTAPMAQFEIAA